MAEIIPFIAPNYRLSVIPDENFGCVRIIATNAVGYVEDELWCTREQAIALIPHLEAL